jgi:hypothetical protein
LIIGDKLSVVCGQKSARSCQDEIN